MAITAPISMVDELCGKAHVLMGDATDYLPLLDLIDDARFVLLGEATHGTHEFYRARADITKLLIKEKGFIGMAVEADWPDAYRVNRFIQGVSTDQGAIQALSGFKRFPTWMWRNADVLDLVGWLREENDRFPKSAAKFGFYGLDLYSLFGSIDAVLKYLEKVDPASAARARYRYSCFDHYGEDTQAYGYAAGFGVDESCEREVVAQLEELRQRAAEYARRDGRIAADEYFFAEQNARLVRNAEEYYRTMFRGQVESWNLRDQHMAETFEELVAHLERQVRQPKLVVWAHNSHILPLFICGVAAFEFAPEYPRDIYADIGSPVKTTPESLANRDTSVPTINAKNPSPSSSGSQLIDVAAGVAADTQEIKDRIKELEVKEREHYALMLDGQRKTIDWWFNYLAVLTALMALFGGLIPFLMARKDKEVIEQDKATVRKLKENVESMVKDIRKDKDTASAVRKELEQELIDYKSGKPSDTATTQKTEEAVKTIQQDPEADLALKLRAKAVAASEANDADKAYALWHALAELNPNDATAQFNAGYWAQDFGEKSKGEDAVRWLKLANQYYDRALAIDPHDYTAAYNWGNALGDEAKTLASNDLQAARQLWLQAGEKYQQALALNPDKYEAAFNWGNALGDEAKNLAPNNLPTARQLWLRAGEKYQQALALKPDEYEAAFNWGTTLGDEATALASSDLPTARQLWLKAGEKFQQALALKSDMPDAALNWGVALAEEARALAPSDLPTARQLWLRAGEKYQQALALKSDMPEAAFNWGNALAEEARALASSDLPAARQLWLRAGEKFQQALALKSNMPEAAFNRGNALADEARALAPSDLPTARQLWLRAGEKFQQALALKPDEHEAAFNWGTALVAEARALAPSDPSTARQLWLRAGEKFQQALALKSDLPEAAFNWGNALAAVGRTLVSSDFATARSLWQRALEKYQQALAIQPDDSLAHFSCARIYALLGQTPPCCDSLSNWKRYNPTARKGKLDSTPDFDNVRNAPEFLAFRAELPD